MTLWHEFTFHHKDAYCVLYSLMFLGLEEVHPLTLPRQHDGKASLQSLPPL